MHSYSKRTHAHTTHAHTTHHTPHTTHYAPLPPDIPPPAGVCATQLKVSRRLEEELDLVGRAPMKIFKFVLDSFCCAQMSAQHKSLIGTMRCRRLQVVLVHLFHVAPLRLWMGWRGASKRTTNVLRTSYSFRMQCGLV